MHSKQFRTSDFGLRNTPIRNYRKGFMHSLEGTIAAMLLLFYALEVLGNMNAQQTSWTPATSKQEMQEFLIAFKSSDYRGMLFSGKLGEFSGIARYFLGEGRGYAVTLSGLPKDFFEVGVIINRTANTMSTVNKTACIVPTEFSCYNGTFQGTPYYLADYVSGAPDGREYYDVIYFDFDGNSIINSSEGPFTEGNILKISGTYWDIGRINNATGNVSFWEAERLVEVIKNVKDTRINGRETKFSVRGATFDAGLSEFDAIAIAGNINVSRYEGLMREFMQAGGGVVWLRNISSSGDIGSVEKNIFGLAWVDNSTTMADNNGVLPRTTPGTQAYLARKYFIYSGLVADTGSTNTGGYITDGIPNNETAHIGNITLRRQKYAVLVTMSLGSPVYDRARVDAGDPKNNFTYEAELSVGGSIIIDGNNYTLKEISSGGTRAVFSVKEDYSFADFLPQNIKLYPVSGSEDNIFANGRLRQYNITPRALGSKIVSSASESACTGGEATLPPGAHNCGTFSAGANYPFAITNVSKNYTLLNIDWNMNGAFNDPAEPTYSTGTLIEFGPEKYRAYVDPAGAGVTWALEKRRPVPYATINYPGVGAAVWMPDTMSSADEWSLFTSALMASANKEIHAAIGSAIGKWSDAKAVFFENNETYQPYEVGVRMWY